MSDTPETDAKASPHIGFYSCATVPADFARRLERERDEAREELRTAIQERHDFHWELLDAIRERDEAREERDELRSEINYYRIKHDLLPISWDV